MTINVYADGTWDLLHYNHIEFLQECRSYGDRLIVGVVSDRSVLDYKQKTILTEEERVRTIRSLGFVDEVILVDGPFNAHLMRRLIAEHDLSVVVYGSPGFEEYYGPAEELGIMRRPPYRSGISSREIISRILRERGHSASHQEPR